MKTTPSMEKVFTYARKIYTKKLENNKNLLELTTYNNISMWWTTNAVFRVFLYKVINGGFHYKKYRKKFTIFYKTFGIYLSFIYDLLLKLLINLLLKLNIKNKNTENIFNIKKIIAFNSNLQWRLIKDFKTNKMKKTDSFYDILFEELNKSYIIQSVNTFDLEPINGLKIFIDRIKNWQIPYKPLNLYWSIDIWKKRVQAFRYFSPIWKNLKNDKNLKEICVINGMDLYPQIKDELDFYFSFLYPHAVGYIEMGRRMIRKEKPNLIILQAEYEWKEKSFLVIAPKLENIPTLALEHGVIIPSHKGYIYTKGEISPIGDIQSPYNQIPDKTAVYGEYYKELLTKISAYPENSIVVTGQPSYDALKSLDKIYSKKNFMEEYNIPNNYKLIIWFTQSHGLSQEENIKNLNAVFNTMKYIKNTTLIIKQHPGEGKMYSKQIQEYLNKYKINARLVPKNSDTNELLFNSDVVISKYSTTGIEAIALNKPLIVLNLSGKPDLVDYVSEGVALGVYQIDDLQSTIETLLKDDSMLDKNRKKYVEKYLFKIDGKSTERVVNIVNSMVNAY